MVSLVVSVLFLALSAKLGNAEGGYRDWSPETFPNSMRDFQLCRVDKPSYVCDPNGLLEAVNGKAGTAALENALEELRNSTKCACPQIDHNVCDLIPHGFTASVAVVERMKLPPGRDDVNSRTEAILQFADDLRIRFPRGQCYDDLFIVLSANDSAVWTSVGRITELTLRPEMVDSITAVAKKWFRKGEYTKGLQYMVDAYAKVLRGEKITITDPNGWYWPIPLWSIILVAVCLLVIVLGSIGLCIKCCCCRKTDGYTLGQRQ
ncbi:hypothetical protein QR680_014372 [Steinernema hermaphroditum]|uniref:Uncharacterized protein n=1 Tax=Steinernema hermaphroditum TaxID=289476 RepID=A0AA39I8M3_9BILA|nr:hypothetical protein QR680_014372 [Steinernema hermaphroditum]